MGVIARLGLEFASKYRNVQGMHCRKGDLLELVRQALIMLNVMDLRVIFE
jgi:hypothetical protein